jgi:colanic acid/amylovoran biosynthesis glycosyltransferase
MIIGYLTSTYARAVDSFIRGEVIELRALGHTVETFSIRRSPADEMVSEEVLREQANTEFLLGRREIPALALATAATVLRSPGKFLAAARLLLRCGAPGMHARMRAVAYLMEACLLARRLKAKSVRHLHNHIGENSAMVAMLASLLSGIPFSLTIHGPDEFDRPQLLALDEKIARAAFVVAISNFGRSQLMRWSRHEDWAKVKVIHCGVDATYLDSPPTPFPTAPRFVCVGRLTAQKGQLLLIDAAAQLAREGLSFELVLVGDGPLRAPIERLVDRHGLRDRVKMVGWMSSDRVREQVLAARAMVLPSLAEGLPVVIMEALALRRPVISTYIAGIPELLQNGVCGWLVPPGSVSEVAAAMREALNAPLERLEAMGCAGAALVAERHDARKEVARLAELICGSQPAELAAVATEMGQSQRRHR